MNTTKGLMRLMAAIAMGTVAWALVTAGGLVDRFDAVAEVDGTKVPTPDQSKRLPPD